MVFERGALSLLYRERNSRSSGRETILLTFEILWFIIKKNQKKEVMYVKCGSNGEYGELNSWKGNAMPVSQDKSTLLSALSVHCL